MHLYIELTIMILFSFSEDSNDLNMLFWSFVHFGTIFDILLALVDEKGDVKKFDFSDFLFEDPDNVRRNVFYHAMLERKVWV